MGFPSCGTKGRCHGEWGSFSCQCTAGYSGHQCEQGKMMLKPTHTSALQIQQFEDD